MSQVTVQYLKYIYLQYISIFSIFSSTIFEIYLKLASNKKQDTRPGLFFKVFTVTFDKALPYFRRLSNQRLVGWENTWRKIILSSFFFTVLTYLVTFNRLLWHHKRSREEQRCSMVAVLGSCFLVFNQYLLTVFRLKDIFLFQKKYLQKKQFLAYLINQTIYTFFQSFPWHSLIRQA